jgi:hypothetical protein
MAGYGRLGHGNDTVHKYIPHRVDPPANSVITSWHNHFVVAGSQHSFAIGFPPEQPTDIALTKNLRVNEGSVVPHDLYFRFLFEPSRAILADENSNPPVVPPMLSVLHNLSVGSDNALTMHISGTTFDESNTANGITTLSRSMCLVSLALDEIEWPANAHGVYTWLIRECGSRPSDPGTSRVSPSHMDYDSTVFEMRVRMVAGHMAAIEFLEFCEDADRAVGGKLDYGISFVNTYTRMIESGALEISKVLPRTDANANVDESTPFQFTLQLFQAALTSGTAPQITFPFTAQVLNEQGAVVRDVTVAGTQVNFTLRHNERLVINQLPAGTGFTVTEQAHPQFRAQAYVYIGGSQVASYSSGVNTALSTERHTVSQAGRNAAEFANTYFWVAPTGLWVQAPSMMALFAISGLLALLVVSKRRNARGDRDRY